MCITFKDIYIVDFDIENVTQTNKGTVIVPYNLSVEPPNEWKEIFLESINWERGHPVRWSVEDLPFKTTKIIGKQVMFECRQTPKDIKKDGICWEIVADHIVDANERYREFEEGQMQEKARIDVQQQEEEQGHREFGDFKRQLRE